MSVPAQRRFTFVAALTQAGIAVTGAVVRVTGSGLGCPTWPQCFPGSMVPTGAHDVPAYEQAIEFGNRLLTYVVTAAAVAVLLVVLRAGRRTSLKRYAWSLPLGTVVQAVLGGITVLTGLEWWTVALHLLVSTVLVWLAVQLHVGVGQPDTGQPHLTVPPPLRTLLAVATAVLAALMVAGTMVTGAGPHAGNSETPRLDLDIPALAQLHAELLVGYLGLLVGAYFAFKAVAAPRAVLRQWWILAAVVLAQGGIGVVQYFTGVPEALVAAHVAGACATTWAMAALWARTRVRTPLTEDLADRSPQLSPAAAH
ncbi:COX15/CtaA family protein [Rhodococcus sp. X156]|uniref:COX15/CtaA family protein n=1 Tax=Rhodococcus sp. X156 TaxID=2499145 RepID=UPI001F49EADC|nr:COX15/CtaA family protein [Rhodococcus sp. X156]